VVFFLRDVIFLGAYPGTAFSRSFGDMYAEELGVFAEPEVKLRDIQAEDLYIMIASDGVFEFMTNQALANIVDHHDDPLKACKHVCEQAYGLWLQYEVRTDDITAVCIYLQDHEKLEPEGGPSERGVGRQRSLSVAAEGPRPVRRNISREKQKYIIEKASDGETFATNQMSPLEVKKLMASLKITKTAQEEKSILTAISENFLFRHLNETQLHSMVEVIQRVPVLAGDVVIKQGDFGDLFYIAQAGTYEVRVMIPGNSDPPPGTKVHTYRTDDSHHPCFGELALMYDKPRAATIIALENGVLWALDRNIFKYAVLRTQNIRNVIIKTLRNVKLFKSLNAAQIQRLADLMVTVECSDGDYIITQGHVGESFFIIVEGNCIVTLNNPPGSAETEKVVGKLKNNDYFGERALLTSDPRAANIIAEGKVELLEVKKNVFEEVLGRLASIMAADKLKLEKLAADRKNNAPNEFSDIELVGFTSMYPQGSIVLGKFNSEVVNVTAKTFLLANAEEKFLKTNITNSYAALKLIITDSKASSNVFIPRLLSCYREKNAFHFVYGRRIVTDIGQIGPLVECPDISDLALAVPYVGACVINALEALHSLDILYRNIHPESVHIDLIGRICLLDMNMSKIGAVQNMTYTICGDPEYMAPEQISQQGHNGAVDLWALGVLLFELIDGKNPFQGSGEVVTFSKISSFGSSVFPSLSYDEDKFSPSSIDLITKLVRSDPAERLGMGKVGYSAIKEHHFFSQIDWNPEVFSKMESPFEKLAKLRVQDAAEVGCADDIVFSWKEENSNSNFDWLSDFVA
jgi:CRP-like cAMP-binding protein